MAVHIRLQRRGSNRRPFYHVVAADHRARRDGRYIERLGYYNPGREPSEISLSAERLQYWYKCGAQLSKTAEKLAAIQGIKLERNA